MHKWISPVLFLLFASAALAEHRAALLISNSQYEDKSLALAAPDLSPLVADLQQYGFRCEVAEDLPGKHLKAQLQSFARRSPTRGSALVFFFGQVLPGAYKGEKGLFISGIDTKRGDQRRIGEKGYELARLLELLGQEGGSLHNLLVVDAAGDLSSYGHDLPEQSLLAFVDTQKLSRALDGTDNLVTRLAQSAAWSASTLAASTTIARGGSTAIAPPDKFVLGKRAGDQWVNSRGMVFCWCPPGKYLAGSPETEPDRYPDEKQREVVIKDGFWIAKYEVTFGQWPGNRPRGSVGSDKLHPVNAASQSKDTARRVLDPLTKEERAGGRLPQDWEYALPTEEQWEYAARAGTKSRFYFGEDLRQLPKHANFGDKSYYDTLDIFSNAGHRTLDDGTPRLAKVGSYQPNPWGLHDVYGNVAEWCADSHVRGGSWVSAPQSCRSAYRDHFGDRDQRIFIGSRFVIQKVPPPQPKKK